MVLSDQEIQEALDNGNLGIAPPVGLEPLIQASSIDLRLADTILVTRPELVDQAEIVDPTKMSDLVSKLESCTEPRKIYPDQPYVLAPRSFVIGTTAEKITLSNTFAARVEGKSSLARFGVAVHLTAPKIDPGYSNFITLELVNLGPFQVYLSPLMEIAALIVERLGKPALNVYQGRFTAPPSP